MNKCDLGTLMKELTDMEPDPYEPANTKSYRILVSKDISDAGELRFMVRYGKQYLWFWMRPGYVPEPVIPMYAVDMQLEARYGWVLSIVGSTVARNVRISMGHAF